jgi:hypothetical protein
MPRFRRVPPLPARRDTGNHMSSILIGVFDNSSQAREAHARIAASGIDLDAMNFSGTDGATAAQQPNGQRSGADKPGVLNRLFGDLFGNSLDVAPDADAGQRGHCVLTVALADEDRADRVSEIMENCGAIDIDLRAEAWRGTAHPAQQSLLPDDGLAP